MRRISNQVRFTPRNVSRLASTMWSCTKWGKDSSAPVRMQIELSGKCNLKCPMCPQSISSDDYFKTQMIKFDAYKKIFDTVKPLMVDFTGQGETTLNPDLYKIAAYTHSQGAVYGFNCNFTLLSKEKFKLLYDSGLSYIGFSLDAINKTTYEKIRKGAKFEIVMRNFQDALAIDKRGVLTIGTVITNDNIDELEGFITYCSQKFKGIPFVFSPPLSYGLPEVEASFQAIGYFTTRKEEFLSKIGKALSLAQSLKLTDTAHSLVDCRDYFKTNGHNHQEKPCYMPYTNVMVYANGEVMPCCYMPFNREKSFGNIYDKDFFELWNGKKYQQFRTQLRHSRESIKECTLCRFYSKQSDYIIPLRKVLMLK